MTGVGARAAGTRPWGSDRVPANSYAIARMEVDLAWTDLEDALACHDPRSASEAAFDWWHARAALRDLIVKDAL